MQGLARWSFLAGPAVLFCSFFLLGCPPAAKAPDVAPPEPGEGKGLILVESPRVFERERLVRDREQQDSWLRSQLDLPDEAFDAFQGAVQSRSFRGSSASLDVNATAAGGLAIRQAEAQEADLARAQELAELNHQLQVAELRAQIAALGDDGDLQAQPAATTTESTEEDDSGGGSGGGGGDGDGDGGGSTASQLPTLGTTALTVGDRPIDRFRDRLTYRDEVRQRLLDNALDDSHDLLGNTLYRLAFDATVLPENDTSDWAIVHVEIDPTQEFGCVYSTDDKGEPSVKVDEKCALDVDMLAQGFTRHLTATMSAEVDSLRQAYFYEDVRVQDPDRAPLVYRSDSDGGRFFFRGERFLERFTKDVQKGSATRRSELSKIRAQLAVERLDETEKERLEDKEEQLEEELEWLRLGLDGLRREAGDRAARVIADYYRELAEAHSLGGVVKIRKVRDLNQVAATIDAGEDGTQRLENFCWVLKEWPVSVDTYAVTPRESVERISDFAAAQSRAEREISAAISAGKIGLSGGLEYLQELENQRQGIRRQPLTVAYSVRNDEVPEMGWILGPRYQPRYGKAGFDFRHRPSHFQLSSIVSLPAWWTSLKLKVSTCWASEEHQSDLPGCSEGQSFSVNLPGDARSLVSALFPLARKPRPFFYGTTPELQIGRKERLLIYGDNLWRNPQVFLGNQPASGVAILPDMQGLVATFDSVLAPSGCVEPGLCPKPVDAWVWTSEGNASAGLVELRKPKSESKDSDKPKAKLGVEVEHASTILADASHQGEIRLVFDFPKADSSGSSGPAITTLFLDFGTSVPITPGASVSCLTVGSPHWKITGDCTFNLGLRNLAPNTTTKLRVFRTKDNQPGGELAAEKDLVLLVR